MKINLYGELVSDEWSWLYDAYGIQHFCPKQVREAIEQLPFGEELILEVNSPGGDVWSGFEIFGLIQGCQEHTEAHIIAMAASAATTVCSACDTVLASPVAQIMIHQPSALVIDYMNNTATAQLQNFLDSVKASIINGYVIKSAGKATRKTFEKLVDQSTYMPVQDAIDLGLVDGLLDTDDELLMSLCASGGVAVKNAAGMSSTPKALLERYEAAVRAGTMEEVPGHPVKNAECRMQDAELSPAGGTERITTRQEPRSGAVACCTPSAEGVPQPVCALARHDTESPAGGIGPSACGTSTSRGGMNAVDNPADWKLKAAIEIERARAGV